MVSTLPLFLFETLGPWIGLQYLPKAKPKPSLHVGKCTVITEAFLFIYQTYKQMMDDSFSSSKFKTFKELETAIEEFEKKNFVAFQIRRSESIEFYNKRIKNPIRSDIVYRTVEYACTHYGEPRKRGKGKQNMCKYQATGCTAILVLTYNRKFDALIIDSQRTNFNHTNHIINEETFLREYKNRKLDKEQQKSFQDWVSLGPKNELLLQKSKKEFGKSWTLEETRRLKSRMICSQKGDEISDLVDLLETLEKDGARTKILISDDESKPMIDLVAYASQEMIDTYKAFPGILFIDGTYKVNRAGYPLYQIMIEDAMGKARPVFFSVVRRETDEMITQVLKTFSEMVGDIAQTSVVMTDKCDSEAAAIRNIFPEAQHLLCYFHVIKALKERSRILKDVDLNEKRELLAKARKVVDARSDQHFDHYLSELRASGNQEWIEYFEEHWLNCRPKWALCDRIKVVNYLNDTDNKCESSHRQYKTFVDSHSRLTDLFSKLAEHSKLQQSDMTFAAISEANSHTDFKNAIPEYKEVYSRFTKHAVLLMIDDHNMYGLSLEVNEVEAGTYDVRAGGEEWTVSGNVLLFAAVHFTISSCCHVAT